MRKTHVTDSIPWCDCASRNVFQGTQKFVLIVPSFNTELTKTKNNGNKKEINFCCWLAAFSFTISQGSLHPEKARVNKLMYRLRQDRMEIIISLVNYDILLKSSRDQQIQMDWLNINMDEKPILRIDTEQFFVCTASFNKWIKDEEGRYSLEKVFLMKSNMAARKYQKFGPTLNFSLEAPRAAQWTAALYFTANRAIS